MLILTTLENLTIEEKCAILTLFERCMIEIPVKSIRNFRDLTHFEFKEDFFGHTFIALSPFEIPLPTVPKTGLTWDIRMDRTVLLEWDHDIQFQFCCLMCRSKASGVDYYKAWLYHAYCEGDFRGTFFFVEKTPLSDFF